MNLSQLHRKSNLDRPVPRGALRARRHGHRPRNHFFSAFYSNSTSHFKCVQCVHARLDSLYAAAVEEMTRTATMCTNTTGLWSRILISGPHSVPAAVALGRVCEERRQERAAAHGALSR